MEEEDDLDPEVLDDGLDIDAVEEFNEADFDEDFDDDFEEEIVGEYDWATISTVKSSTIRLGTLQTQKLLLPKRQLPTKRRLMRHLARRRPRNRLLRPAAKSATKTAKAAKPAKAAKKPPARKK